MRIQYNNTGKQTDLYLKNVLFCPESSVNLISIPQLITEGSKVDFNIMHCDITPKQGYTIRASLKNGLYVLAVPLVLAFPAHTIPNQEAVQLWHQRMGHLGQSNLQKLQDMSTGMDLNEPPNEDILCEPCVIAKATDTPHISPIQPSKYENELLHVDILGPINVLGPNREKYGIVMLEDKTKESSLCCLVSKDQVLPALKSWIAKNESGSRTLCRLRLDNAREQSSREIAD